MPECRGCIEKGREPRCWVEHELNVCCDCAYPTPQDRQRKLLELQGAIERIRETVRDKYARAALQGLITNAEDPFGDKTMLLLVVWAFKYADKVLEQRLEQ